MEGKQCESEKMLDRLRWKHALELCGIKVKSSALSLATFRGKPLSSLLEA